MRVLFAAIACGIVAGYLLRKRRLGFVPPLLTEIIRVLLFLLGAGRIRQLDPRMALMPVATVLGRLAGAVLAMPLVAPATVGDSLAVGRGSATIRCRESLSPIFVAPNSAP